MNTNDIAINESKRTSRDIEEWFAEYSSSHGNPVNKLIHWICVPSIFVVIMALLWSLPVPAIFESVPYLNWATLSAVVYMTFYIQLSKKLAVGLGVFAFASYALIAWYEQLNLTSLWSAATVLFVVLWVFQFIGHYLEGKKPSFFEDLTYLLVGPAWVIAFIYRKLGISY
jgi:uncharacterized membrane protein YGL010W